MVLIDKQIKELVNEGKLIVTNYKPENLGGVSYDLTIDNIIAEDDIADEYVLKPKEFVIVKTNEELYIPENMVGKIEEKNSLLRLGLFVSGPVYQPGHRTYSFLRAYNMSNSEIKLQKDAVDPDDVEMLQDLILTSVNEALRKVDEAQAAQLGKYNIPGLM